MENTDKNVRRDCCHALVFTRSAVPGWLCLRGAKSGWATYGGRRATGRNKQVLISREHQDLWIWRRRYPRTGFRHAAGRLRLTTGPAFQRFHERPTGGAAVPGLVCARAGATTGEWAGVLREVFGSYREFPHQALFDDRFEVVETRMPALLTVVKQINDPRHAGLGFDPENPEPPFLKLAVAELAKSDT